MLVISVSPNHIELEPENRLELLRLAQLMNVTPKGNCKASVIFIAEDLTDGQCDDKLPSTGSRLQLDFLDP